MNKKTGKQRYGLFAMLAVIVLIAASGLIAQPMFAEARGPFGKSGSADEIVQTLTDRLELTQEQTEAIRPVIEDNVKRQKEIRENSEIDRKARRTEIRKLRWNTEIRLSEILNDEQVDRYLEFRHEQGKAFKRGRHHGGWEKKGAHKIPEQFLEHLRSRLDMTQEQVAKASPIILESIEKRRAIFEKYRDQDIKAKQEMRSEMQAIGDETHAQLATILNEEQKEKLNVMKEEKRERINAWMDRHGPKRW